VEAEGDPVTLLRPFGDDAEGLAGAHVGQHSEEQWGGVVGAGWTNACRVRQGIRHYIRTVGDSIE